MAAISDVRLRDLPKLSPLTWFNALIAVIGFAFVTASVPHTVAALQSGVIHPVHLFGMVATPPLAVLNLYIVNQNLREVTA